MFVNLWRHCGTRRTTRTDCKGHRVQQSVSSSLLHAMRAWCSRRRPNKPYQADSSVFFAPRPQWPQCPVFCAFAGRPRGRAARRGRRSGGTPGTPGVYLAMYNSWPTRGEGRGWGQPPTSTRVPGAGARRSRREEARMSRRRAGARRGPKTARPGKFGRPVGPSKGEDHRREGQGFDGRRRRPREGDLKRTSP